MKFWLESGWEKKELKLICGGGVCVVQSRKKCTGKSIDIVIPLFCLITPGSLCSFLNTTVQGLNKG